MWCFGFKMWVMSAFESEWSSSPFTNHLCLFGYPKNFEKSFNDLQSYILNKYEVDVYCHLWWEQNDTIPNPPWATNKTDFIMKETKEEIENKIKKLYNPKKIIVENSKKFIHNFDNETSIMLDKLK